MIADRIKTNVTEGLSVQQCLDFATLQTTDIAVCPKASLLFSLRDKRSGEFGPPTPAASAHILVASIMGVMREQPAHQLAIRPNDFEVYLIGSWAPSQGEVFNNCDAPHRIGSLPEIIEVITPNDLKSVFESIDRLYNNIMKEEQK